MKDAAGCIVERDICTSAGRAFVSAGQIIGAPELARLWPFVARGGLVPGVPFVYRAGDRFATIQVL